LRGKVLKSTGKWYEVELENHVVVQCRLRGKIRLDQLNTTNPIAAGDRVLLAYSPDQQGDLVIDSIEKRHNYIVRRSTNLSKQMQIIAANIDHAYLLVTVKNPITHRAFIDRFLVAAESFRIPTSLLFNKIDICTKEELDIVHSLAQLYQKIGYATHLIQANREESVAFLRNEIAGKQVLVSGHSGTGKSTFVHQLDPSLEVKIGAISSAHLQGKHTTTFAQMYKVSFGGYIIDTPGIKAFGMTEIERGHISHYFPEMRQLLNQCQYDNCQHLNEPKCAVKLAVEKGGIASSRYKTYCQLITEDTSLVHRRGFKNR